MRVKRKRNARRRWHVSLPDENLAYLPQGSEHFDDYVQAVQWAQRFARVNRELMMQAVTRAVAEMPELPPFDAAEIGVQRGGNLPGTADIRPVAGWIRS